MDYTLTEEQQQLVKLVEEFVRRDVKPHFEQNGYEEFPWPLFRKLGEIGLAAIPFPTEYGGGGLDYSQWAAILRAVSALTAYHHVYHESLKPLRIADLLLLNDKMPRSLASCYGAICANLDSLAQQPLHIGCLRRGPAGFVALFSQPVFNSAGHGHRLAGCFRNRRDEIGGRCLSICPVDAHQTQLARRMVMNRGRSQGHRATHVFHLKPRGRGRATSRL